MHLFYRLTPRPLSAGFRIIAYIIEMKPMKQTTGATLIRRTLKMSLLNTDSSLPAPLIRMKPRITTNIPTANSMKLVLSKA